MELGNGKWNGMKDSNPTKMVEFIGHIMSTVVCAINLAGAVLILYAVAVTPFLFISLAMFAVVFLKLKFY